MSKEFPKVLFYDIETSPIKAYVWGTGKQFVGHHQIVKGERTKVICITYKWAHEKKVHALTWNMKTQNCDKIIDQFSKVIEEASVAIAHNGDRFDVRQINTQRLMAGKDPIAWPTTEDSLKQLRQIFYFPSYRLDYISKLLLDEGKSPMSFDDWVEIIENKNQKALNKIVKYCKRDTKLLAEAYEIVQPFLKPRVNRALLSEKGECPSCGHPKSGSKGYITLKSGKYQRRSCKKCGHNFRLSKAVSTLNTDK